MSGGRLPKRIVFGNLEGAVRRGQGGKEKEWTDCVQSDIRAFGIAGDCCLLLLLLFLTFSILVVNPKKLLNTVANPARGLLTRGKKKRKKKVWQRPPSPARCSFGEKKKEEKKSRDASTYLGATQVGVTQVVSVRLASVQGFLRLVS